MFLHTAASLDLIRERLVRQTLLGVHTGYPACPAGLAQRAAAVGTFLG